MWSGKFKTDSKLNKEGWKEFCFLKQFSLDFSKLWTWSLQNFIINLHGKDSLVIKFSCSCEWIYASSITLLNQWKTVETLYFKQIKHKKVSDKILEIITKASKINRRNIRFQFPSMYGKDDILSFWHFFYQSAEQNLL